MIITMAEVQAGTSALALFITSNCRACQERTSYPVRNRRFKLDHSGNRPSYMMLNSPYTWAQFRIVVVHFLVASKVAKYSAFSKALSLGNTLRWRFSLRYVEFRDSIEFVVYMTFLTSDENLNIGLTASQLSDHLFIEFGYFGVHFSVTRSRASKAFFSSGA